MTPSSPEVKGGKEVIHDDMNDAGHKLQANRAGKADKETDRDSDD